MDRDTTIQDIVSKLKELRLQEVVLTQQLEEALKQPNTTSPARRKDCRNNFTKGGKIFIKNRLKKPANWTGSAPWNETEGKTATVTNVIKRGDIDQIHFVTDNGVHTWRACNNISHLDLNITD